MRVRVSKKSHFSLLLRLAVEVGFDWVYYAHQNYVRLSVIPDSEWARNNGSISLSSLSLSFSLLSLSLSLSRLSLSQLEKLPLSCCDLVGRVHVVKLRAAVATVIDLV